MKALLILCVFSVAVFAQEEATTVVPTDEEGCRPCPTFSTQHFTAQECVAVTNATLNECCPAFYHCKTEAERNIAMDQCYYDGTSYEIGQTVPVVGPCRRACTCKNAIVPGAPARIECGIAECVYDRDPDCRELWSNDECCPIGLECSEDIAAESAGNVTVREADCTSEGFDYFLQDKILFSSNPCKQCICTPEFTDENGPGCTNIDCGITYRDRAQLLDGCTPLYTSDACCPIDWICPGSPLILFDETKIPSGEIDPTTHCTLSKQVMAAQGDSIPIRDLTINCQCLTPPFFTCVRYPTDTMALAAKNQQHAP